jgi:hypothetical protein
MARPSGAPRLALALLLLAACCSGRSRAASDALDMSDATKERSRELGNSQWHGQLHRLAGLMVDEQRIGDLLGPVLRYRYELPPTQVR